MTNRRKKISYHFGANSRDSEHCKKAAFRIVYGDRDFIDTHAKSVTMGIRMASADCPIDLTENWYTDHAAPITTEYFHDGKLGSVETCGSILLFGELGCMQDIENSTLQSYQAIFNTLRAKGYTSLLRSWNYIPDINGFNADGVENYRAFCKGRALAFENAQLQETQMPAATGIGSYSENICGYLLATKRLDYKHIENALQCPAYEYPELYGPKSPSFARATLFEGKKGDVGTPTQFFLSGTASIRKSETMWPTDITKQVQTMMENVSYLVGPENADINGHGALIKLADFEHFKVYFRRSEDYRTIKNLLVETWHIPIEKLIFMNVDICRSDLLVEIEGCINRLNIPATELVTA